MLQQCYQQNATKSRRASKKQAEARRGLTKPRGITSEIFGRAISSMASEQVLEVDPDEFINELENDLKEFEETVFGVAEPPGTVSAVSSLTLESPKISLSEIDVGK